MIKINIARPYGDIIATRTQRDETSLELLELRIRTMISSLREGWHG